MYSKMQEIEKLVDKIDQTMENNDSEFDRRNSNLEAINDFKAYSIGTKKFRLKCWPIKLIMWDLIIPNI